ncbi:shikimate kinase [Amycolatopsis sp. MJM2582]|uniref:shikimate kinase n=1 Tax=Amycolatopsis TaxID=1813 RepID=UPI000506E60A|nr:MULTISPECIES: shikimate kinase [unclassified Amycolatopsis]KFZ78614.1 shikimate kinase [Amycolatopsis sp. MJM2582]RSN41239.1 shikimate kinase [Amycolatopsis sp. WAC 04197]
MTPRAVIIGPPGSGKSTVGPALAARLGLAFRDSDDDIVASAGKPITDIFAEEGEPAFRALEEEMVAKALAEHEGVLSLGGGAPITPGTRERLAGHTVIFLNVGMAAGVQRAGLSTARPLLAGVNPRATYKALLDARLPVYREVATFEIETDQLTADEVVEAALIGLTEISKERA